MIGARLLKRLRLSLIVWLAGKMQVALNLKVDGHIVIHNRESFVLKNITRVGQPVDEQGDALLKEVRRIIRGRK